LNICWRNVQMFLLLICRESEDSKEVLELWINRKVWRERKCGAIVVKIWIFFQKSYITKVWFEKQKILFAYPKVCWIFFALNHSQGKLCKLWKNIKNSPFFWLTWWRYTHRLTTEESNIFLINNSVTLIIAGFVKWPLMHDHTWTSKARDRKVITTVLSLYFCFIYVSFNSAQCLQIIFLLLSIQNSKISVFASNSFKIA